MKIILLLIILTSCMPVVRPSYNLQKNYTDYRERVHIVYDYWEKPDTVTEIGPINVREMGTTLFFQ